jgi:phage terminase small subunit
LTVDTVVDELRNIAFANMADYVPPAVSDDPRVDFLGLGRDLTAAVAEFVVEQFTDGRGEDARGVRRVKFKLHDKQAALVNLGRHLGLFEPKSRQHMTVEVDVEHVEATILGRLARIAAARRAEGGDPGDEPRTITEVPTAVELVEREAAAAAARPKAEYAPGSLEYQALHSDWTPPED